MCDCHVRPGVEVVAQSKGIPSSMATGELRLTRPSMTDVMLALLILVLGVTEELVSPNAHPSSAWWLLGVLTAVVSVLLRTVATLVGLCLLVCALVIWRNTTSQGDAVTAWQFWALMVLVFTLGSRLPIRTTGLAVVGTGAVTMSLVGGSSGFAEQASLAIPTAAAWSVGLLVQRSMRRVQHLEGLARETTAAAAMAVAEERERLARELHDVVAHQVSVMVLLVGAARRRLGPEKMEELELLQQVESTGRHAVEELQRMLSLLRPNPLDGPPPQPRLRELPDLVAPVVLAGRQIRLDLAAALPALSPALELSAYRILQEALTNSLKHSPGAKTQITVRHDGASLHLSVRDDDERRHSPPQPGGRGLLGIAERVRLFNGTLSVGPLPAGGFAVEVVLPAPPA